MAKRKQAGRVKYADLRDAAVQACITCSSDAEAAVKLGISPRTLQRWKARPDFQELLSSKRKTIAEGADEAIAKWFAKLWEYGPEALDVAAESMRKACRVETRMDENGNAEQIVVGDHGARNAAAKMIGGEFSKGMSYLQTERREEFIRGLAKHLGVDLSDLAKGGA